MSSIARKISDIFGNRREKAKDKLEQIGLNLIDDGKHDDRIARTEALLKRLGERIEFKMNDKGEFVLDENGSLIPLTEEERVQEILERSTLLDMALDTIAFPFSEPADKPHYAALIHAWKDLKSILDSFCIKTIEILKDYEEKYKDEDTYQLNNVKNKELAKEKQKNTEIEKTDDDYDYDDEEEEEEEKVQQYKKPISRIAKIKQANLVNGLIDCAEVDFFKYGRIILGMSYSKVTYNAVVVYNPMNNMMGMQSGVAPRGYDPNVHFGPRTIRDGDDPNE